MIPPQANYLLIDGVLRPGALQALYQRGEPLQIEPLYLTTRWEALHDLGPILITWRGPSDLLDETRASAAQQADASLLYSPAPLRTVADHLRRFIAPQDMLGGRSLLRFADPLVTRHWLGSYQGAQRDAVLGPIEAWHVPDWPRRWEPSADLQWSTFSRTNSPADWNDQHACLGQAQLEALQQAARWRFLEQLHDSLVQDYPEQLARLEQCDLTQWFAQRLDEALAWGMNSERGLAAWVERCLHWGDGFMSGPDALYQQWLARTPDALKLAPEQRFLRMENDCLHIESNKEPA